MGTLDEMGISYASKLVQGIASRLDLPPSWGENDAEILDHLAQRLPDKLREFWYESLEADSLAFMDLLEGSITRSGTGTLDDLFEKLDAASMDRLREVALSL